MESNDKGMSRASKKRRKEQLRKKADVEVDAKSIPSVSISTKQSKPSKTKKAKPDKGQTALDEFDIDLILQCEEEEMPIIQRQEYLLQHLIAPTSVDDFEASIAEIQPYKFNALEGKSFEQLFTIESYQSIIKSHLLSLGIDIDLSHYDNHIEYDYQSKVKKYAEEIESSNKEISFDYSKVKAAMKQGSGVCLLSPHTFNDKLWSYLSILEGHFSCRVSCKAYYLPPLKQMYAPRYERYNAFYLQVQGSTSWRIFPTTLLDEQPQLLLFDTIINGKLLATLPPAMEVQLQVNEVLYIPKGWIYEFSSSSSDASLTLAVATNEGNNVADLLDMTIPQALAAQIASNTLLRNSISSTFVNQFGVARSEDDESDERLAFKAAVRQSLDKLVEEAVEMLDAAADQMAKNFLGARLPVPVTSQEEAKSAIGCPDARISSYTKLRMLRPGIARAIVEEGVVVVYHCMDNSRYLHGNPLSPLEFELDDGPAIEMLLNAYPEGVTVSELPHPSEEDEDKVSLAAVLYKEGFLLVMDEATISSANAEDDDNDPF